MHWKLFCSLKDIVYKFCLKYMFKVYKRIHLLPEDQDLEYFYFPIAHPTCHYYLPLFLNSDMFLYAHTNSLVFHSEKKWEKLRTENLEVRKIKFSVNRKLLSNTSKSLISVVPSQASYEGKRAPPPGPWAGCERAQLLGTLWGPRAPSAQPQCSPGCRSCGSDPHGSLGQERSGPGASGQGKAVAGSAWGRARKPQAPALCSPAVLQG